jgi:hypothetical protein
MSKESIVMNATTHAAGRSAEPPWYRQRWPWLLMAPPLTAVLGGIVTIVLAVRSDDGVVVDDYYKRGLEINAEISRTARAAELGIDCEVEAAGANSGDGVRVAVRSEQALPPEPALRVRLVHPGRAEADRIAVLGRTGVAADGRGAEYGGAFGDGAPPAGAVAWRVVIETQQWRVDGGIAAGEVGRFSLRAAR